MAKILIVDDSAMSRRIMRGILESGGHEVVEAEDGMVALEKYFLEKPRIVFLDLIMRGMGGMEVLKKIRELDNRAQIVVATADIQSSTREMTKDEGAAAFISKPFVAEEILATVASVLKGSPNAAD